MRSLRFVFFPLIIFLAACSTTPPTIAPPTPTPEIPAGPFDGLWKGEGRTEDGIKFTIEFAVRDSLVTGIKYGFEIQGKSPCYFTGYGILKEDEQPRITNDSLTAALGPELNLDAVFQSESSASGHLKGSLGGYHQLHCNQTFNLEWTASKQAQHASPTPPETAQKRARPLETLIQILVFGLSNGAVLALNAIGVTVIYSTVRTLNLAHGDVFALTTVVVTTLVRWFGIQKDWDPLQLAGALLLVFCGAVFTGGLLSAGVEQFGFKPFRGVSRFAPVIATLGLSFILFQGALVWRTLQPSWIPGEHRSVPGLAEVPTDGIPSLLPEINLVNSLHLPFNLVVRFSDVFVLIMAVAFAVFASAYLKKTKTGRAIRAVSQNQTLAQYLGINVDQITNRAFAFGGALAGAAAFIFAIYYARPFGLHGAQSGLLAFAAALLGGIGSPSGALLSGLLIGTVSSLSDYYLSAQWTSALMLTLLIGLLIWRPTGLTSSDAGVSVQVRDSVILTAPAKGQAQRRWLLILTILLAILPLLLQVFNFGGQIILRTAGIFIILTLGLNLAFGVAGLLDFGLALSYGLGAYTTAILSPIVGFAPALVGGIFIAALSGLLKGLLGWRLRGDYLAVATLALGLLGNQAVINMRSLTGGAGGLGNFAQPSLFGFKLITPLEKYYLVFAAILLTVWVSQRIINSRSGRAWIAGSEDETAAKAMGIHVEKERLLASIISSALAGMAGSLFASTFSLAEPDMLAFHITSMVLTMVILGGAGSVTGAIAGAAAIIFYDKVFVSQVADWLALVWPKDFFIGSVPDIRGASFFNFGIALYLTVLLRARRKINKISDGI